MKPEPYNAQPGIKDPALNNLFRWMREHPGWRSQNRGVLWDIRCEQCGFTIEATSLPACKDGRKITQRASNRRDYNPVLCTVCATTTTEPNA